MAICRTSSSRSPVCCWEPVRAGAGIRLACTESTRGCAPTSRRSSPSSSSCCHPERRRRSREHPQERDAAARDARAARVHGGGPRDGRQPAGVGRAEDAGRDANAPALRALRRAAGEPEGLAAAVAVHADSARRTHGGRRDRARRISLARQTFEPHERIYARSASDDKSPIVALLAALDALKATGVQPTSNIRVILDGEEEAGSPSLVPAIGKYRDKLTADAMFIFDGPVASERAADDRLRCARQPRGAAHGVRTEVPAAQRALRQLGAEPGDAPRGAPGDDEGRQRQGDHRGLLRRDSAVDPGRARHPRRRARRPGRAADAVRHCRTRGAGPEAAGGAAVPVAQRARAVERVHRRRGAHHHPATAIAEIDIRLVKETPADTAARAARRAHSHAGLARRHQRPGRRDAGEVLAHRQGDLARRRHERVSHVAAPADLEAARLRR